MHASFRPPVILCVNESSIFMSSNPPNFEFTLDIKHKPKMLIEIIKTFFQLIISLKCEVLRSFSYLDQDLN
jgi:hypothetical protein